MGFDISDTLAPASDQLDAIELVAGPRTFTIERVSKGNAEQPVNVHFTDFPRPWRPSKGMRRILAACWGSDASQWTGRRVELFFDPEVTFGKDKPGGTRISALSHIDKPKAVPLLVSRGKSATYRVQPLAEPSGLDEFKPETTTNPAGNVQPRTEEQSAQLFELLKANDLADKDAALAFINLELGRTETDALTSTKHLTRAEADRVIDALNRLGEINGLGK